MKNVDSKITNVNCGKVIFKPIVKAVVICYAYK